MLLLVQLPARIQIIEIQDRVEDERMATDVCPRQNGLFKKTIT
jgi:hypothetical protein